jgi:predicted nucleotide-binding protein (sugar kinase/HSP70/actin superfamily)
MSDHTARAYMNLYEAIWSKAVQSDLISEPKGLIRDTCMEAYKATGLYNESIENIIYMESKKKNLKKSLLLAEQELEKLNLEKPSSNKDSKVELTTERIRRTKQSIENLEIKIAQTEVLGNLVSYNRDFSNYVMAKKKIDIQVKEEFKGHCGHKERLEMEIKNKVKREAETWPKYNFDERYKYVFDDIKQKIIQSVLESQTRAS